MKEKINTDYKDIKIQIQKNNYRYKLQTLWLFVPVRWLFVPARWPSTKVVRSRIFFVGFVKEMKEIIYVVMMFQKIVYGCQDLAEKVVVCKKVEFFSLNNGRISWG
jgi:hypothetical protein